MLDRVKRILEIIKTAVIAVAVVLGVIKLRDFFRGRKHPPKPIDPGDVIVSPKPTPGQISEADETADLRKRLREGKI